METDNKEFKGLYNQVLQGKLTASEAFDQYWDYITKRNKHGYPNLSTNGKNKR